MADGGALRHRVDQHGVDPRLVEHRLLPQEADDGEAPPGQFGVAVHVPPQSGERSVVLERVGLHHQSQMQVKQVDPPDPGDLSLRLRRQSRDVESHGAHHRLEGIRCPPVGRLDHPHRSRPSGAGQTRGGHLQFVRLHVAVAQSGVSHGQGLVKGQGPGAVEDGARWPGDVAMHLGIGQVAPAEVHASWGSVAVARDGDRGVTRRVLQLPTPPGRRTQVGEGATGRHRLEPQFVGVDQCVPVVAWMEEAALRHGVTHLLAGHLAEHLAERRHTAETLHHLCHVHPLRVAVSQPPPGSALHRATTADVRWTVRGSTPELGP